MPIESCIHRQLQQDSVHSVFFYSFKSSLHMQPARTAFEISGASLWFPNIHLCGCGKNLFSQACNYKKDIFIYSHDEVFVLDDYMEKKKKEAALNVCARRSRSLKRSSASWKWMLIDRYWTCVDGSRATSSCVCGYKTRCFQGDLSRRVSGDPKRILFTEVGPATTVVTKPGVLSENHDALPTTPKWFLCLNINRA